MKKYKEFLNESNTFKFTIDIKHTTEDERNKVVEKLLKNFELSEDTIEDLLRINEYDREVWAWIFYVSHSKMSKPSLYCNLVTTPNFIVDNIITTKEFLEIKNEDLKDYIEIKNNANKYNL